MIKDECKYYQDGMCCFEGCVSSICDNNTDCIYKQLVELQEANMLLKDELYKKSEHEQFYQSLLDEVKELKAYDNARQEVLRDYKNALIDIREIADIIYNTNCNYVLEAHKIIDKVNEVLNG